VTIYAGLSAVFHSFCKQASLTTRLGHSIRIALAGADASLFQRYPATGVPTWTVYRETGRSSFLELPVKDR
jgi:hypothetical protein